MSILTVDQKKCTKCGICAEVCPAQLISLTEQGPEMTLADRCNACGHCVAVCPQAALDHERNPLEKQVPLENFPVLDPSTAASFLRSRRSIRCYQNKPVERETILKLLQIARFAPSGGNSQGLSYLVLDDREVLKKITAVIIQWVEEQQQQGLPVSPRYAHYLSVYRKTGKDVILRNAPVLIIAQANEGLQTGWDSARYALAYVELYATALGLGTCWSGFVEKCASARYGPLLELLPIGQGKKVCGAIMAGYPLYTYSRMPERNPLDVTWGS